MTDRGSQGLARAVFALLVIATAAAFFVTQRLKHAPTIVQQVGVYPFLSPDSTNHHLSAKLSFRIKRADDVTVTIVDASGQDIATLARNHPLAPYTQWSLRWRGRTDAGRIAPDGVYRIRVRLRRQGRSALLAKTTTVDTVAPRPLITRIISPAAPAPAAGGGGPAILPVAGGGALTIDFDTGGGIRPQLTVYRTDVAPARALTTIPVAPGGTSAAWNGTVDGRPVAPGTYLVAISATDRPGNLGQTPSLPPRGGQTIPGHAGITVRYLGVEPPVVPVDQNAPLVFGVDARRAGYAWSVTRVGAAHPRKKSTTARAILRMRPPGGIAGAYVLAVHTTTHRTAVPFVVAGPGVQPVLVVVPAITWLGEDPLDDDGDGLPNTLTAGDAVRTDRILTGLPAGFATAIAPLLTYLDGRHLRYDITTDLALARGLGPALRGHAGVALAGDERWIPASLAASLRAFVRGGGKLAAFGVDSLRRTVKLAGNQLSDPSEPTAADAFGARLSPVAAAPGPITDFSDRIGLFNGAGGQFTGYATFEPTASLGPGASLLASAVTADGRQAIVAARYGHGLLIRTGLPGLAARLAGDATADALVNRIWALISR